MYSNCYQETGNTKVEQGITHLGYYVMNQEAGLK